MTCMFLCQYEFMHTTAFTGCRGDRWREQQEVARPLARPDFPKGLRVIQMLLYYK